MLVVKNSKNPAFDANSLAKHSKLGEEAGSCCNHSKNPGWWCLRALPGGRLLMRICTQDHNDVLETRCEEHTSCNSLLHLCTWQLEFVSARLPSSGSGHHPGTTNFNQTRATLDIIQRLSIQGCLRGRKMFRSKPHEDRYYAHTNTICIPDDC